MIAMKRKRMFRLWEDKPIKTWNPVVGCEHNCVYCWARRQAKRLRQFCEDCYNFVPHIHKERLRPLRYKKERIVFVVDMGDLFGSWVPSEWILKVLDTLNRSKNVIPLFLTKNPRRYHEFIDMFPKDAILGATIETNRYYSWISKAPEPMDRIKAMMDLEWPRKFISIEPILDFNYFAFLEYLKEIQPIYVEVGYDNYCYTPLPEPSLSKTLSLIEALSKFTKVNIKNLREPRHATLDIYTA